MIGMDDAAHDALNALAVAKAVLEGMLDGVLERSDERLRGVLDALGQATDILARKQQ